MDSIYNLQQRADALRRKNLVESISPEEVGGLHADTLAYMADMEQNIKGLGIHKVYKSVAEMNADSSSPVGTNGKPLRFGQLVTIYDNDNLTQTENGYIYAFQKGSWLMVGKNDKLEFSKCASLSILFEGNDVLYSPTETESKELQITDSKGVVVVDFVIPKGATRTSTNKTAIFSEIAFDCETSMVCKSMKPVSIVGSTDKSYTIYSWGNISNIYDYGSVRGYISIGSNSTYMAQAIKVSNTTLIYSKEDKALYANKDGVLTEISLSPDSVKINFGTTAGTACEGNDARLNTGANVRVNGTALGNVSKNISTNDFYIIDGITTENFPGGSTASNVSRTIYCKGYLLGSLNGNPVNNYPNKEQFGIVEKVNDTISLPKAPTNALYFNTKDGLLYYNAGTELKRVLNDIELLWEQSESREGLGLLSITDYETIMNVVDAAPTEAITSAEIDQLFV